MAQSKEKLEWKKQRETKEKELKDVPIQLKWFSFEGIKTEVKRIRWIKFGELLESTGKVLAFCVLFGIFFVLCDLVISKLLLMIGVGA
ncbi:MAG: preprotein translocase subunit SecE [Erysipelotrichaceae bacterium]|jgi:preprotein translocase SecE subunit|nr:preprotein translocase subunit SecE [Erysipelotrichaceae bacterium]